MNREVEDALVLVVRLMLVLVRVAVALRNA